MFGNEVIGIAGVRVLGTFLCNEEVLHKYGRQRF